MSKVFMQGNQAMAESAIRAGCKLFFGYPITPSSEVPEYYAKVMRERPEENITFIQAETEVAAFNMVAGAAATGHRAMTATPGLQPWSGGHVLHVRGRSARGRH